MEGLHNARCAFGHVDARIDDHPFRTDDDALHGRDAGRDGERVHAAHGRARW